MDVHFPFLIFLSLTFTEQLSKMEEDGAIVVYDDGDAGEAGEQALVVYEQGISPYNFNNMPPELGFLAAERPALLHQVSHDVQNVEDIALPASFNALSIQERRRIIAARLQQLTQLDQELNAESLSIYEKARACVS